MITKVNNPATVIAPNTGFKYISSKDQRDTSAKLVIVITKTAEVRTPIAPFNNPFLSEYSMYFGGDAHLTRWKCSIVKKDEHVISYSLFSIFKLLTKRKSKVCIEVTPVAVVSNE